MQTQIKQKIEWILSSGYPTSSRPGNSFKSDQLLVSSFNMWDENNYLGHVYPTEEVTEKLPEFGVPSFDLHT